MQKTLLYPTLFILLLFVQCNPENEEDLYYEPLIEGIFNVSVDPNEALDFTIEPNEALTVNGQFDNGIPFSVEFEANAMRFNEAVEASIQPVTGILDMPSEFQFNFGFIFSPEGVEFNKPGKMTIELPPDIDVSEFKGFYFQGGVPYGNSDAEIWSVKLIPILYKSENGKKLAVFEIPHFSGFVGVSGGDFKCGNPLAADYCEDLKEILACYITGKESLSSDDRKKVNNALRDWLDSGLDWLEENPSEMDDEWEIELALSEILCWKAAALMFNSTLAPFDDQLGRVGDLFTRTLIDKLVSLNNECLGMSNLSEQAYSFGLNGLYINLMEDLRSAGLLNEDPGITHLNYCDGIATSMYYGPLLDATQDHIRFEYGVKWAINFGGEPNPAVARSRSFTVYATNLLGEEVELSLGEDYTIQNLNGQYFILEGTTITEELTTCYRRVGDVDIPYPCYPNGGINFNIVLNTSGDAINVRAGRYLW